MATHGGARTGAGRKPGAVDEWNELSVIRDSYFWVEGRITILSHDEDTRIKRDTVSALLRELGLSPQTAPITHDNMTPRRRWASRAIPIDEVRSVIADHPGQHIQFLAKEIYYDPNIRDWSSLHQRQSENKAHIAIGKLIHMGRVVRRFDMDGRAVYFEPQHPDVMKYATSPIPRAMREVASANLESVEKMLLEQIPDGPPRDRMLAIIHGAKIERPPAPAAALPVLEFEWPMTVQSSSGGKRRRAKK